MRIRTQSLVGNYVHIDEHDPAIDRDVPQWGKLYERAIESGDISIIPLKNGTTEPPTIWTFRHLTAEQYGWVTDTARTGGAGGMFFNALALALVGVKNVTDEAGREVAIEREPSLKLNGWQAVKTDQLNALLADEEGKPDPQRVTRLGARVMSDRVPPPK